jgi:hypothetical protein
MASIKECPSCGAQNDVIFTNCMFCKSSLPRVDENSITNDELVMKASEWVGKSSEPMLIMQGPHANEWTGKGIVKMMQAEIIGNAEKYLNLLQIRATSNPTLSITYLGLRDKLDKNVKSGKKKKYILPLILVSIFIAIGLIITLGISSEKDSDTAYQERLDSYENQIEIAIKEKNYDYALILIEKLVWTHELNYPKNQKKAESYTDKRKELKDIVSTLKKENQNGNN